ncbi:MAG: LEA type 2 family protein [Pseudomonadales bacterium]|nr:LEA type 2 family protein [Pseudomonadales bacterium]
MNTRFALLASLCLGNGLLAGCASYAHLETPRLSIINVAVQKSDLFEQRLLVRLRVQNPNDRDLPIKGISYRLELAGEDFAQGVSGSPFNVPAFGEAEFDMSVTANMATALLRMLARGGGSDNSMESLDYRMIGKVSLSSGLLRSIPFEEKGSIKLH